MVRRQMEIRVSICGTGTKIREHIRRVHDEVSTGAEALRLVIEEGVSGESSQRNMGMSRRAVLAAAARS
jgi:predicted DNA-binding protein (UPF0251 family)